MRVCPAESEGTDSRESNRFPTGPRGRLLRDKESSPFEGNVGVAALSKRTAKISASSWTRRGRMETVRHWKRRWAYSRFSSSMPSSVRLYVSSRLFGKSSKTLRMPAGKQRRSLSIWHTTHRNLCDHVSVCCEAPHNVTKLTCRLRL